MNEMNNAGSSSSGDSYSCLLNKEAKISASIHRDTPMDPLIPTSIKTHLADVENKYKIRKEENGEKIHQESDVIFAGGSQSITEESDIDEFDIKYGAKHVVSTFKPVVCCMLVVIISLSYMPYYKLRDSYMVYTPFHEKTVSMRTKAWQSIANASIVITVIILITSIFVLLYKYRCMKIITGWLIFASMILMFVFFGIHLEQIFSIANIPVDYITILFCVWNYAGTGILIIHWKGPLNLHQSYLIINSALFALLLIKYLPDWTTWVLLAFLSIWDLVAVLCPKGPLRALVETAQERNDYFPSIIYSSTMVWLMTTNDSVSKPVHQFYNLPVEGNVLQPISELPKSIGQRLTVETIVENVASTSNQDEIRIAVAPYPQRSAIKPNKWHPENEEDRGVKIGLGDLVFYSVLVGKASSYGDWNTTLACSIAILIGLCITLILLAIFKMPLPALPISIFFGLLFYFTTSKLITPYLDKLSRDNLFL